MRWPVKSRPDSRPDHGAVRYRIRFAWYPVRTDAASGPHGWDSQWIWLEKVMETQYYSREKLGWGWEHSGWDPVNEFTIALYEHNNQ